MHLTTLRRRVAYAIIVLLFGACSTSSRLERSWESADGTAVLASAIYTGAGERHCDWQSATFLGLGRASEVEGIGPAHYAEYVRDPNELFAREVMGAYVAKVDLPPGAVNTGYSNGQANLWIDPSDESAVYMEVGGQFERWPRFNVEMGCD